MKRDIFRECKRSGTPLAGLSAHDFPTALLVDRAGLDFVLVGDSLGVHALGLDRIEDTTVEDMIHHCRAVSRAVSRALVIGDMPSGSYDFPEPAVGNARRLVEEGGVDAVKVEGGREVGPAIRAIVDAGIPVVGHLASEHAAGDAAVDAALAIERSGASALVLVNLHPDLSQAITAALTEMPSLGYRSGPHCDGHLLVTPIMMGLTATNDFAPGPYGNLGQQMLEAFRRFRTEIHGAGTLTRPRRCEEDACMDPVQVVEEFIEAFNARDVDRIVGCFSADAVMQDDSGTVFAGGQEAIRAHFGRFLPQSPNLHSEMVSRIHVGCWVVQEEHVTGLVLDEPIPEFSIPSAYRVEDGKIVKCIGLK